MARSEMYCFFIYIIASIFNIKRNKGKMLGKECQQDDKQFQSDLDKLMKDVRQSQEHFITITQYILKIINTNESQNYIFVNQDIFHYRTIIEKIRNANKKYQEESLLVIQRYAQVRPLTQSSSILMKRVTYRLLEIIFNSIGSINNKIPQMFQEYLRLKINCQKLLQENTNNKPYLIFKSITDYQFKKLNKYLQLFNQLTNHLQNGNLDRFNQIQINCFLQNHSVTQTKFAQTAKPTFFSTLKINKIRVKQKQASKPEMYTIEKNTDIFIRKAKKIFESLKDVMQINKQQFLQDYTSYNQKNKDNLIKELRNRNKLNNQAINQFYHKKKKIQNLMNKKIVRNDKCQQILSQNANQDSLTSLDCRPINTTRRSLLIKLKANQNHIKILPSELFRKTSKIEYENRLKLKSYHKQKMNEKVDGKLLGERLKEVIGDNNEEDIIQVKQQSLETIEEKLPFLNKRAQSVDQNYKLQQQQQSNQVRTLSNSLKINEDLKIRSRIQKIQMHPVKVKLQLKAVNILASLQVNKRSAKLGEMSKCLYF